MTDEIVQLSAKRVEMLKEALPKAASIAVIWNANDEGMTLRYRGIEQAAKSLRLNVQALGVREPDDFAVAFSTMTRRRPDALFLVADAFTSRHGKRVIEYCALHRSDFQRLEAGRLAGGTAHALLLQRQPQDGDDAGVDHSALALSPRG
jgi:putative ABC transport system substrate-binding protein